MGVPAALDGKLPTPGQKGSVLNKTATVGDLYLNRGPAPTPFTELVAEFVKGLSVPAAPEQSAGGIAPSQGLRQAQLQAQSLGTLQLAGDPLGRASELALPDF